MSENARESILEAARRAAQAHGYSGLNFRDIGAAIGLMMWMWITSIVILFGAELNSEIEHQTARDSTVEGDKPLGARGATMADTVGKVR